MADRAGNEDDHHAAQGVIAGDADDLAARFKAGSNEESEAHPEHDQTQIEVRQRDHLSAAGEGRLANLVPLFVLRKQTPEPQRVHLVNTATEMINKIAASHGGHGAAGDTREPVVHRYFPGLFTAGSPRPRSLSTRRKLFIDFASLGGHVKVVLVHPSKVVPYARNPRKNQAAIVKVAASIKEFGFRQPIVVDSEMTIVVGHTRYLAAMQLGMEKVPVHVAEGLTPSQIKAYRIMDNRSHEDSEWDEILLPLEFADLKEMGFDLELTGFDEDEIADLFASGSEGLTDPDEVPEPPDEAITQPGDLWVLGDHRLLCGDSSRPEDVDRLLGRREDPPGQHRPAVQRQGRASQQQRHRRREQFVHEDASPEPGSRPSSGEGQADHQEDAGQGSTAGERLRLRRGVRPAAAGVVWEHRPGARARAGVLHLGRLRQLRQLSAGLEGEQALLRAGDHLGQGAPGPDAQGLHGKP